MKRFFAILLGAGILLFTSCEKDFEEVNRNPFAPTTTEVGPLFNGVIESLQLGWSEQFYLHNESLYGITQQAALTAAAFQNISIGTEEAWSRYYYALANVRELEKRFAEYEGDPEALNNVQACLKIILAYKTFRLTDLFGDIPFFEAGRGFEGVEFAEPAFDSQESIYKFLLEELAWAEEHINVLPEPVTDGGEAYVSFGAFDNLLNGDMQMWRKFANSLRLRHAMRMVEKDPGYAAPILTEIIDGGLPILEEEEVVALWPGNLGWLNQGVHWSFREHKKLRMGSTIWQQLSDNDNTDGSGIFDPRARIFFETNNAGEWVPFPQIPDENTEPSGGIPYQSHRDINYPTKGASNIYSPFNYYLIRDEAYIPEIMMTAAELNFIKAEAFIRGLGVPQSTSQGEAEYTLGVFNSMQFWQNIFLNTPIWTNAPQELTVGELYGIINNHPKISIFTSEEKLEFIYRQRWIDAFRQPWEAFALMRRTSATPHEGDYPDFYRFSYPPSEAENNPGNWSEQVAAMGGDSPSVKIWWIK